MNFEAREHSKWQKFKLVQIWVLIRIFQRKIMHQLGSVKAGMLPIWGKVQDNERNLDKGTTICFKKTRYLRYWGPR